ncbi:MULTISPECIES: 2-C-methyl-D-erythritol 4-phosphate cytidylyltransferase [Prochlorococcus]|uniref:2-C-methyl-D-erythritol 4-phosphate cytidylyltransferase n=1 Tax=Prochlorococcus TaxID=1218 RepID=UPI000563E6C5|nr:MULTISPECIES: 2-C-methyl-D-erythritol 4-phosphate cytidylyltransferase [Prochlorococcus]
MHLLIASAGIGSRMGAGFNKLLLPIAGKPILKWTLDAVDSADSIKWIGVIGQPGDQQVIVKMFDDFSKPMEWIQGGKTRQESVERGLAALPTEAEYVLIHDGARCLIEPDLLNQCSEMVEKGFAVIAATPVTDTIKKVDENGFILDTPDRDVLWAAQTPQGFQVEKLKKAHEQAIKRKLNVTDDASLFEKLGWPVKILQSGPSNIKVTTPFDLSVAEAIIAKKKKL